MQNRMDSMQQRIADLEHCTRSTINTTNRHDSQLVDLNMRMESLNDWLNALYGWIWGLRGIFQNFPWEWGNDQDQAEH